jgi:branched-chain amino acid transport system permease protein
MSRLTRNEIIGLALMLAVFVLLLVLPLLTTGYLLTLLTDILKFIILTVAWVIFSGPTGYISLASAAFYGLGFYVAAVFSGTVPFAVTILMAGLLGFVVALAVGALTLRLRGVYFAIFTFGLVELVRNVLAEVERVLSRTRGRFVSTESTEAVYLAIVIVMILTVVAAVAIRRSRYGLALQSIGEHEEAAAHSGINVVRTKVFTFALSAVFMGMAGAIIATRRAYIDPGIAFDLNHSFLPVLMAIFGGMANLLGPVIGAVIFTYLGEFLLTRFPDLYMLIFGTVLIVAILFLPNGLLGLVQSLVRRFRHNVWRRIPGGAREPA